MVAQQSIIACVLKQVHNGARIDGTSTGTAVHASSTAKASQEPAAGRMGAAQLLQLHGVDNAAICNFHLLCASTGSEGSHSQPRGTRTACQSCGSQDGTWSWAGLDARHRICCAAPLTSPCRAAPQPTAPRLPWS